MAYGWHGWAFRTSHGAKCDQVTTVERPKAVNTPSAGMSEKVKQAETSVGVIFTVEAGR